MNEAAYKTMVRAAFNEASTGYDNPAMRFFDKSAEHLVEGLPIEGSEHILDVATGTGKVALLVARRLKGGRVTGVDLSEGMIARAREKARQENLGNVTFQRADIQEADFQETSFDGLTCGFGVFFWMDMETTLKQILTQIKPGGFVALTSFMEGSFNPLSDLCLKRFAAAGVNLPASYTMDKLNHPSKHKQLLKNTGLERVTIRTKQMGYYLKDAQDWWDIINHTGYRGFLNQLSAEQAAIYKDEHLREISAHATDQGIFLNVTVIFTMAYKGVR